VPAEDGATDFVKRGALTAGCCGALAPEVVVESVSAGLDGVPVWMERQSFLSVEFRRLNIPPHIGSPTARRSAMGVGEAADNKPSDVTKAVVAIFMLPGCDF
jgi:hypothetical protein